MVAQSVEQGPLKPKVVGSIPTQPTYGVEYAGSTHDSGSCRLGSIPSTPTKYNLKSLGSSVVERSPEEAGVLSSILTRGTIKYLFFTK